MKTIDPKQWQRRSATINDCSTVVRRDTQVKVDGATKIVYLTNLKDKPISAARRAVQNVRYDTSTRTSGLVSTSRIFGYAPRNVLRGHACRAVSMAVDHPEEHNAICAAAEFIDSQYRQWFPEIHKRHQELLARVKPEWVIPNSVFTSGIVNYNNPLQYHFDAGNFAKVCSAMIGFRHKTMGGFLACPEIDMAFEIGDRSLILFDGQNLLHGVTPIQKQGPQAFRYTIVYYSLQQMWNCDTVVGEIDALRARRSTIEAKAAAARQQVRK